MSQRKATPRGQMSRSQNSGPAIMLMPPQIRSTFMPNPPLKHIPPVQLRRRTTWTGMAQYTTQFEKEKPPERAILPTPKSLKENRKKTKREQHKAKLQPQIDSYRESQQESGGEFQGMNCYNTLFVGRLAYEVNERKLLREMEAFGPVKDIKITKDKEGKSRGYAFVEFEHEDDMKRAYRAADGMRIEGRDIVVDVERGHTVPAWLPRRLGGGLGGTRLGGKDVNWTRGRFDPSRPEASVGAMGGGGMGRGGGPPPPHMMQGGMGRGGGPPQPYGRGGGFGGGDGYGPPRGGGGRVGGGMWERDGGRRGGGGGGGDFRGKRPRSPSPDRRSHGGGGSRRRY